MAIKGSFYQTSGNDRPYYYSDFNANFKDVFTNGIATRGAALSAQMEVSKMTGTMKSQVNLGIAYTEGIRSEIYTAAEEVTHSTADPSNPRIDIVALEVNTTAPVRNSRIVIVEGTPAGSPTVPALTETATQYQMSLCEVTIPAGATSSDEFTYTDKRQLTYAPVSIKADNISLEDAGGHYTAGNVEAALAEIAVPGHVVGAHFKRSTDQVIPSSGYEPIVWNTYTYNPDNSHDTGNLGRMIVRYAGIYTIMLAAVFEGSGMRGMHLRKNGSDILLLYNFPCDNCTLRSCNLDLVELDVNDYLEVMVSGAGAAGKVIYGSNGDGYGSPFLSMRLNRF